MKLLILLITLLAGTNPSSSMPVQSTTEEYEKTVMNEILEQLQNLEESFHSLKQKITDVKKLESKEIQTPLDIKDACACGEMFKEKLNISVRVVESIFGPDSDYFYNILDNLEMLTFKTAQTDNCHFKNHTITNISNIKTFLYKQNIKFIQQWNTNCSGAIAASHR